jgi:hypothetical protein
MAVFGKLIVGRSGDDSDLQAGQGGVVDDGAQRTGREHIAFGIENRIGGHRCGAEFIGGPLDLLRPDIGNRQPYALVGQMATEMPADIAQPLHIHAQAVKRIAAQPP